MKEEGLSRNMETEELKQLIHKIIAAVEKRVPEYAAREEDRNRNEGNCALCIIEDSGTVRENGFHRAD